MRDNKRENNKDVMAEFLSKLRFLRNPAVSAPILALFVLLLVRMSSALAERNAKDGDIYLVVIIIQIVVFLIPASFYYQLKGRSLSSKMFIAPIKLQHFIFVGFVFLLLVCGNIFIKYFLYTYNGYYSDGVSFYSLASGTELSKMGILIAFCAAPAICEELFFRGVLLSEYRQYGAFNAVVVSSLIFTLMHFSVNDFLPCFFSGILFGFITVTCRSVFPSMLLHFCSNYLSIYGSDVFLRVAIQQSGVFFVTFVLIVIFGLSLFFVLARLERVYYLYAEKPPIDTVPPRSKEHLTSVYFSPTFLAAMIILIILMFTKGD